LSNPWPNCPKLPEGPAAALAALHLSEPRPEALGRLSERAWREALDFCYRSQLALALRNAASDFMPAWVREQTDRDAANNIQRLRGIEADYRMLGERLDGAGIDFVALKGITQCPLFGCRAEHRPQSDIDLFCTRESVTAARDALLACGYESIQGMEDFPTDHLPVLIRRTGWEWRGDFFDPEMPMGVELHFQFWNPRLERLPAPDTDQFWARREKRPIAGVALGVLCPPDAVAYAALHLLRHVLRGSVRPFHVYEVAGFLNSHSAGDAFWPPWRDLHSPELRRLQAVSFRLAQAWFGCALGPAVEEEIERLPAATHAWFADFATSPATQPFHSNKDELWLHLSLLHGRGDALRVARRRLLPGNLPPLVDAPHVPKSELTWRRRARHGVQYAAYFAERLWHHAAALWPTAYHGARWWWRINGLGEQFWTFLAAAVLFNLALFIFVLLYNLYLMDLGFGERFLGVMNGAARAGSLAGTLPAAFLAHRLGLKNALLGTIGCTAAVTALRAVVVAEFPLTALSFVSGAIFAVWAVVMAPSIAGAVAEKRRPAAFSLFFAVMFGVGIAGNWLAGRLAGWMHGKQPVLLLAAALTATALLPALRLRPAPLPTAGAKIYPRGPFLVRFLVPFAIWHLATGAFNPFGNVYFARLKYPVQQIGNIFSTAQLVQVVTVLLAPLVIGRFGLVRGIVWMMAATALGLSGLAAQPSGAAAPLAFMAYMGCQWMSEPGLNTLLMNHVAERERSGASALNFLVAFSAQAVAAFAAGALLDRFGYGWVLAGAAVLGGLAAALFSRVPENSDSII
jgi:MFS family permease